MGTQTTTPSSSVDRSARRAFWLAGLYFAALTVVMTWPLVQQMGRAMLGQVGDNIYFVWMISWFQRSLFQLHVSPFNIWFFNYPEGWNLAYTEITPAQIALALPISLVSSPMFAYNATLMLTFVLSGMGMYLWVRHLTGRTDAAFIAGTLFAFLPYRFAHVLIGHLNLSGTQWFPFYFMGFFDLLLARRPASGRWFWKPALLGGIGLGLIALTSQYYLYMTLLISAWVVLVDVLFLDRTQLKSWELWKRLAAMGLVALPLILVAVAPFVVLSSQGGLPDRNLSIVRPYSASPTDFLLPSTDHFLWGTWVGAHFNREMWVEGTLYVGAVSLALAALAWVRRRETRQPALLPLLLWGALMALLLAMGTDLHWNGAPVSLPAPAFLAERLNRSDLPILLPGYFLFKYFPFYAKLRALMRFGVFVLIFCSAAAGIGSAWLLQRTRPGRRAALTVLLLALVFVDFYPGPYREFASVTPRPVDTWLAAQPEGAMIQFPFIKGEDQEQTYYTLTHNHPFVGGFFNAFPPPQYARVRPLMENFPDAGSVNLSRELGARYVLVDLPSYPDAAALRQRCEALGLAYVDTIGDQMVFLLER